jgi:hypothetical protein
MSAVYSETGPPSTRFTPAAADIAADHDIAADQEPEGEMKADASME